MQVGFCLLLGALSMPAGAADKARPNLVLLLAARGLSGTDHVAGKDDEEPDQ